MHNTSAHREDAGYKSHVIMCLSLATGVLGVGDDEGNIHLYDVREAIRSLSAPCAAVLAPSRVCCFRLCVCVCVCVFFMCVVPRRLWWADTYETEYSQQNDDQSPFVDRA